MHALWKPYDELAQVVADASLPHAEPLQHAPGPYRKRPSTTFVCFVHRAHATQAGMLPWHHKSSGLVEYRVSLPGLVAVILTRQSSESLAQLYFCCGLPGRPWMTRMAIVITIPKSGAALARAEPLLAMRFLGS